VCSGNSCQYNIGTTATSYGIDVLASDCTVKANDVSNNGNSGMYVVGDRINITANYVYSNGARGIHADDSGKHNVSINYVYNNTNDGILISNNVESTFNEITSNYIYSNGDIGINLTTSAETVGYQNVSNNWIYNNGDFGIYCFHSGESNIIGNHVIDNSQDASGNDSGIYLLGSDFCNIAANYTMNTVATGQRHGIEIAANCTNCKVTNNYCYNNVRSGVYSNGIGTIISENHFEDNGRYGIELNGTNIHVKHNTYSTNFLGPFLDSGTGTKLPTISVPFVAPLGAATHDVQGILVDGAITNYARTYVSIPDDFTVAISVDIEAYSNTTETHSMNADILFNWCASNEAINNHSKNADDESSVTTNFTAGDLIYWRITANINTILPNDSFMAELRYAPANGDDCETDCAVRSLKIRYI